MIKKSIYKIPDGKLVKIKLQSKKGKITSIKITGDFFMYPEEKIFNLERYLSGCEIKKEVLLKQIDNFWKNFGVECFGINSIGLTEAILMAK